MDIGRGTSRQQQGDNHQGSLLVIARRQGRGFGGVQIRSNSAKTFESIHRRGVQLNGI